MSGGALLIAAHFHLRPRDLEQLCAAELLFLEKSVRDLPPPGSVWMVSRSK